MTGLSWAEFFNHYNEQLDQNRYDPALSKNAEHIPLDTSAARNQLANELVRQIFWLRGSSFIQKKGGA